MNKAFLTLGLFITSVYTQSSFSATIPLSGNDATGYLALASANTEKHEPNTAEGKAYGYPYFENVALAPNFTWDVIVAEPLSASSIYAQEQNFEVKNTDETDADFADFNLGTIEYDETLITGTGTEVISPDELTINIDTSEFDPMTSERNINNEFSWTYGITLSNVQGNGLTFIEGQVSSIDLVADVTVDVFFLGNESFKFDPAFTQEAAFTIVTDLVTFDLDITQDSQSLLGSVENARMVLNRSVSLNNTIDPEDTIENITNTRTGALSFLMLLSLTLLPLRRLK